MYVGVPEFNWDRNCRWWRGVPNGERAVDNYGRVKVDDRGVCGCFYHPSLCRYPKKKQRPPEQKAWAAASIKAGKKADEIFRSFWEPRVIAMVERRLTLGPVNGLAIRSLQYPVSYTHLRAHET